MLPKALIIASATAILAATATTTAFAASTQTYQVQPGDTFYKIAVRQGISLAALEAANPQITNYANVIIGTTIQLPSKQTASSPTSSNQTQPNQTASSAQSTASVATAPSAPVVTATPGAPSYTVQPGDTLFKIAVAHGITLSTLESLNPALTNVNNINVGQILQLPALTSSSTTVSSAPVSTTSTSQAGSASSTTVLRQKILSSAESLLGVPYVWGGVSPSGFDCSGFVEYVYLKNGITLPRESHDQATVGTPVSEANLQPGDLLFFSDTDSYASQYANGVTHVGIYIGNGSMIESSSSHHDEGVVIVKNVFSNPYYIAHYYGARNVIG